MRIPTRPKVILRHCAEYDPDNIRTIIREGLIELCRSDFTSAPFAELAKLEPKEQASTAAFHDLLHELRWYVSYTEDMPSTVKLTVAQYVRRLEELHHLLRVTLGPPEALGHRVIDA